jgi:UDP-N-acetylmuramoyl-L-alanyl-D-glutamate--2,6-diaminopimelate ligase
MSGGSVRAIVDALRAAELLAQTPGPLPERITGITDDSRTVVPDGAFVAVRGTDADGHAFIAKARESGAALVIAEDPASVAGVPALLVSDARRAAAVAAAAYYANPAKSLRMIAVTGTNGKTTSVGMIRHLLDGTTSPPRRSGSIGTLGVKVGSAGELVDGGAGLTTPGPIELQRILRLLVDRGVTSVAIEVSSHALAQHRVEGVEFAAALFTNLTRDHLDYHGSMEAYRDAKLSLATKLAPGGFSVVNADDPAWMPLRKGEHGVVTYGTARGAEVRAEEIRYDPRGSRFRLVSRGVAADVALPLIGAFNVVNALGAATIAIAFGMKVADVAARLGSMPQIPGRLERIASRPAILRDYAHTPDALERALTALRPFVHGKLVVVFGAGGDRDPGKRPIMGAIAAKHADVAIVTSDNPRTEDPEKIIDAIVAGMGAKACERIEDRRAAIARAIALADPGDDLILLAGKGHEDYQIRGTEKLRFDEREVVAEIMAARGVPITARGGAPTRPSGPGGRPA